MSQPIRAKKEQLPQVVALSDKVFRNAQQSSMGVAFSSLFSEENSENLWIVEDADKPVSLIGILPSVLNVAGCHINVASMGSVCTDPEYRGQNFATMLLNKSLEQLHEEKKAFLFISGDRGLYIRNNCMHTGQVQKFNIGGVSSLDSAADKEAADSVGRMAEASPAGFRPWRKSDVQEMLRLLQTESAYFERSEESFLRLIEGEALLSCYSLKQHIWVSEAEGKLNGYIVFGMRERDEQTFGETIEFAGGDDAVIQLMREVISRNSLSGLNVTVPNFRTSLASRLAAAGTPFRTESISGTIRMIHFPALWESLFPYFEAALGSETARRLQVEPVDNGYRISLGDESLIADLRMATALVFDGPHLLENGALRDALQRVFPLPMVNPDNLNYV